MTVSDLDGSLLPVIAQLQNTNQILAGMVALIGVVVGVLFISEFFRRF